MKTVATDITALWFIRRSRVNGRPLDGIPMPNPDEMVRGARGLRSLGLDSLMTPGRPSTILIPANSPRTSSRRIKLQEWDGPADRSPICFQTDHEGLLSLRPEACLLMLARTWSVARLAMLASELCGKFTLTPYRTGYVQTEPACTLDQLRSLADACPGAYGIKRLRDALQIAGEGAESPLEVQVGTWLRAPLRLGGYSCGNPLCNPSIQCRALSESGSGYRTVFYRLDLFWPAAQFGVECDGGSHDDARQHDADNLRDMRLSRLGIREIRISARSLDSFDDARMLAETVRASIGLSNAVPDINQSRALWQEIVGSEWEHLPMEEGGWQQP